MSLFALSIRLSKRRWRSPVDAPVVPRLRRRLRLHYGHASAFILLVSLIGLVVAQL